MRVHVAGDLEPVWADHDRLEQVFVNLLENAASHGASPRGTDVTVRAGGAPGWAEVEIADYGAGIPAGLAEKMFEPRVRGTTEVAGTGLGLPMARGIVEAPRRRPWWWRRLNPGASFVVALPADPPPDARSGTRRRTANPRCVLERRPGTGGTGLPDKTVVLIVEDDQNIVDLVRSNLSVRGHDVIARRAATSIARTLELRVPDVVLLDLMLPDADGFELCREIRELSEVGIIVLSARRAETDKVRALNLGADDYMTKPFGIEELLARINATLRRSRPAPSEPARAQRGHGRRRRDRPRAAPGHQGRAPRASHPDRVRAAAAVRGQPGRSAHACDAAAAGLGPGYETQTEYTRVYVARLRAKLESPDGEQLFITEPRSGYRFATA